MWPVGKSGRGHSPAPLEALKLWRPNKPFWAIWNYIVPSWVSKAMKAIRIDLGQYGVILDRLGSTAPNGGYVRLLKTSGASWGYLGHLGPAGAVIIWG